MQISERPQTRKSQQILNCLPYIEQKIDSNLNSNFPENLSGSTIYIVPMNISSMEDIVSQIYALGRSFFVSYCNRNENYYKSVTSTT